MRVIISGAQRIHVTGATSGIGQVLCKQLAAEGHALEISGRSLERLSLLRDKIRAEFAQSPIDIVLCDFANESSFSAATLAAPINGLILMPPQPSAHGL